MRRAVGILPAQKVFLADVTLAPPPRRATGRPARHPVPSAPSVEVAKLFAALPRRAFRSLSWRRGTKGPLKARFAAVRVRVADGPVAARARHLPGDEAWLVCEERAAGERKYHLANHPPGAPLRVLAAAIKARWVCEQMHQQMKGELGLDHFEGRSWRGLHHHALLCQIAYAFLQHLRLGGETRRPSPRGTAAGALAPRIAPAPHRRAPRSLRPMSRLRPPPAALPVAVGPGGRHRGAAPPGQAASPAIAPRRPSGAPC
jgi:SRSO17 transposase